MLNCQRFTQYEKLFFFILKEIFYDVLSIYKIQLLHII